MQINLNFDTSTNSAPKEFKSCVIAAAKLFDTVFSNNITLNLDVGFGECGHQAVTSALGNSISRLFSTTAGAATSALVAQGAPGSDQLPSPAAGEQNFNMTQGEGKALGLVTDSSNQIDGSIGFSSTYKFSYDATHSHAPVAGTYDFFSVVAHEISEVMGRISSVGSGTTRPIDLFRYSAPGVLQAGDGNPGYFSIDGGKTALNLWNNHETGGSGDLADWLGGTTPDSFGDSAAGVREPISSIDLTLMKALGWTSKASVPILTKQTADENVSMGKAFSFKLAADTFTDSQGLSLTYTAAESDNAALPSWLHFNASTLTFTGTAPTHGDLFSVTVTATDSIGLSTSESFAFNFKPTLPTNGAGGNVAFEAGQTGDFTLVADDKIKISVPKIVGTGALHASGGESGSLAIDLVAYAAQHTEGDGQTGYILGTLEYGPLKAGHSWLAYTGTAAYHPAPDGTYYLSLELDEYTGTKATANGYETDSTVNLAEPVVIGVQPNASVHHYAGFAMA